MASLLPHTKVFAFAPYPKLPLQQPNVEVVFTQLQHEVSIQLLKLQAEVKCRDREAKRNKREAQALAVDSVLGVQGFVKTTNPSHRKLPRMSIEGSTRHKSEELRHATKCVPSNAESTSWSSNLPPLARRLCPAPRVMLRGPITRTPPKQVTMSDLCD